MTHYLLAWCLSYHGHTYAGTARFDTLQECETAKQEVIKHKIVKDDFEGFIECRPLNESN
jgi:hypothetical protein